MDHKTTRIRYKQWKDPPISVVTLQGEIELVGNHDKEQTNHDDGNTAAPSGSNESKNNETFTVEDAVESIGFGRFQWKLSVITGLSWLADAAEMMILSILGPELRCQWQLTSLQVALITSKLRPPHWTLIAKARIGLCGAVCTTFFVVFIGMGFSSYLWGSVCDRYGRKQGMVMSALWILFYGLLSGFAPNYAWILILRGLVGIGIGGVPQVVTYYSEFLPTKSRGTCLMLISVFWALGATAEILLALWVMPTLGWHWLLGLSTLPVLLFLSLCFWLPESIRFHVMTGNRDGAVATLNRIAADNGKTLPRGTLSTHNMVNRGRIKDLLIPQYRRTTLLLWFIWFVNVFSYYGIILLTTELFQSVGVCTVSQGTNIEPSCGLECKPLTISDYKDLLGTTFAEFPGLFVVVLVINIMGRKKTMAGCFVLFSICIFPIYACIGRKPIIILIFMARAVIAGGYQVVYVYTPEVFPTETRAVAMGTCSGMGRLGALLTPFVAQVLLRSSVRSALSLYCGFCLLAAVAAMLLPVETSGRGLHETSGSAGGQETGGTSPAPALTLDTRRGTQ